jgi:cytidylate kinase
MIATKLEGLAISGEAGSGKTSVAQKMAELLGRPVYMAGSKFRESRHVLQIGARSGSNEEHNSIDDGILATLRKGGVAEGRAAGVVALLNNVSAYTVLLDCPPEERYRRIWERDKKSYKSLDEVIEKTSKREEENHTYFTQKYGLSYLDSSLYDLTINTGIYDLTATLELVLEGMTSKS